MWCSDPFMNHLSDYGYCVMRLPKADVKPLHVMTRQGKDLDRLGELTTILVTGNQIGVPPVEWDVRVANISGVQTSELTLGLGLSVLGTVIGAMGGSKLGLDLKYQQAKTIMFEFSDVMEDRVQIAQLDQYLSNADVNPFSRYVEQLLEEDDVYVITATLKTKKLTVEAKQSNGVGLDLGVPEIQGLVGGNVKVTSQAANSSKLTYEGTLPLVFGFQAVRLFYENRRYTAFEPVEAGTRAARGPKVPEDRAKRLLADGRFIRLN